MGRALRGAGALLLLLLQMGAKSNRSSREISCRNEEYYHLGFCCEKCPAGKYVSQHCQVQQGKGHCEPCHNGEDFTEYDNGLDRCLSCKRCRPDEDIVRTCTPTKNARCQCKPGSFCLPDQVCEHCSKCTERCPEGEVIVEKCNATANMKCEGNRDQSEGSSKVIWTIAAIPFFVLLVAAAAAAVLYSEKRKKTSLDNSDQFAEKESTAASLNSLDTPLLKEGPHASVMVNEPSATIANTFSSEEKPPVQEANQHFAINDTGAPPINDFSSAPANTMTWGANDLNEESYQNSENDHCQEKPSIMLPENHQHNRELTECDLEENMFIVEIPPDGSTIFYTIINEVPAKEWRRFMRTMRLKENDIEAAVQNNPWNVKEQSYQMLCTWREALGNEASVNKLLMGLCDMGLKGCSENIQNSLIKKGIYSNKCS